MSEGKEPRELPLFPLNTVLFPGMILPLRVFEPRYRQMMDFCMERERTFGVVLIKSGAEVGEPAEPYAVGSVARIEQIEPQPDGTLAVAVVGAQRFALLEVIQKRPFQIGLVEYLDDTAGPDPPAAVVSEARDLAARCLQHVLALNSEWVRTVALPEDPARLSYLVGARLPVDRLVKQRLLEASTAAARLEQELPLLRGEEHRLSQQLLERLWVTSAALN